MAVSATEAKLEAVRTAVEPAVCALGLELYDIELVGGSGARTLRVTVTRDQGVDLETITAVTRAVSPILDGFDAVPGSYLLEVSSPGVERVLRLPAHFRGAVGEQVSIKIRTEHESRRVHGVLVETDSERCIVETDAGTRDEISIDSITQARTLFAWGPTQPAPARSGSAQRQSGKPGGKQRGEAIA